ncbi:hypothetical protein BKA70DRAFT_1100314 [Coprinopsis sp. MPI-PUGE-AT-0042]|nr:hypothetical protein BKA70DRAFT_1100314 [Coprinopsis sp. MPI-PUGE-AT-0042]
MSIPDLEHLALSPSRYAKFARANANFAAHPARTQTFAPINPFFDGEQLMIVEVHLLPGGRYLVGRCDSGVALWDLGYNAGMPAKGRPFAAIPMPVSSVICAPQPTPNGRGVLVASLDNEDGHTDVIKLYEIYPTINANPQANFQPSRTMSTTNLLSCVLLKNYLLFSTGFTGDSRGMLNIWDWCNNTGCKFEIQKSRQFVVVGTTLLVDCDDGDPRVFAYSMPAMQPLTTNLWDVDEARNPPQLIFHRWASACNLYTLDITSSWLKDSRHICIFDGAPDPLDAAPEQPVMEVAAFEVYFAIPTHFDNTSSANAIESPCSHLPVYQGTAVNFVGTAGAGRNSIEYRPNSFPWQGQNHIFIQSNEHLDLTYKFAFSAIPVPPPSSRGANIDAHTFFYTPVDRAVDPSLVALCPFSGRVVTFVETHAGRPAEMRIADFLLPASCLS